MRARYYDPATGGFISRDPVEGILTNPQTQNGYNFTNANPINFSDPAGLLVAGPYLNANAGIAAFGSCTIALVGTSERELGLVVSLGGGGSTGLATGLGGGVLGGLNLNNLNDFRGQDIFSGGSGEVWGLDVSWSKNNPDQKTYSTGPSIGPDLGLPFPPVEFHGGSVYNWVIPLLKW